MSWNVFFQQLRGIWIWKDFQKSKVKCSRCVCIYGCAYIVILKCVTKELAKPGDTRHKAMEGHVKLSRHEPLRQQLYHRGITLHPWKKKDYHRCELCLRARMRGVHVCVHTNSFQSHAELEGAHGSRRVLIVLNKDGLKKKEIQIQWHYTLLVWQTQKRAVLHLQTAQIRHQSFCLLAAESGSAFSLSAELGQHFKTKRLWQKCCVQGSGNLVVLVCFSIFLQNNNMSYCEIKGYIHSKD